MALKRAVDTFEMTSRTDRQRYETLVNRPGVHVQRSSDFFGVVHGNDGDEGFCTITRVVDYIETGTDPVSQAADRAYAAPIC